MQSIKITWRLLLVFIANTLALSVLGQADLFKRFESPAFLSTPADWVDETFNAMTLEERVGQLFMVAAYSNKGPEHEAALMKLIEEQHIGGLIFFKGGPYRQAAMTERLQAASNVPLMLGMDAEWGLAMRLDSTIHFPYQMTLGAIDNDTIIYEMGREIGRELRRLGVHVNFAPVADVNNNPDNPVINYRSFGEEPYNVAKKSTAYMRGLQAAKVMANAKHFPGHGDTDTDSHKDLPVITHDKARLDSIELFPFRQLTQRGLSSMMVAHLYIPKLDSTPKLASTLSPKIVTELLREEIGFNGLVFTDALNMKGVAKYWKPGEVDLKALLAGNDVLLFPEDVPVATKLILQAIEDGSLSRREVEKRCHRILMAKAWAGLGDRKPIEMEGLYEDLNGDAANRLNEVLYERALTLIKNENGILPLRARNTDSLCYLSIGPGRTDAFQVALSKYGLKQMHRTSSRPNENERYRVLGQMRDFNTVVIGLDGMNRDPKKNFGLSKEAALLIQQIGMERDVILSVFGNPYALDAIKDMTGIDALLVGYEGVDIVRRKMAQAIYGGVEVSGKLPVSINERIPAGTGLRLSQGVMRSGIPEEFGLSSSDLGKIDSIAENGIDEGAYPGCVVLVAKEGKVIYEKSFGHHTYEANTKTELDDIFDLASITKIASSGLAIMRLVEEGKIDLDGKLGDYLTDISDTSDYKDLVIRDILTHQARLVPWIPFYLSTLEDGRTDPKYYRKSKRGIYSVEVAKNLYMDANQSDTIMLRILSTPLREKKKYKYSDLGYYLMKAVIEQETGMPLDEYVSQEFYQPMGLSTMGYKPLLSQEEERIVPTEYDLYYRRQLLKGHVHDMGAAMQGGVGGHAGLFSDARDLAALMQMCLNEGLYSNQRLLNPATIREFTQCQFCDGSKDENRRGIVFDKPNRHGDGGPTCDCISHQSFGHSGFTGTLAWADPTEDLVYVFLSNRIYPSMDNKKLIKMDIRTKIMQVIYDALAEHAESGGELESRDLGLMRP